MPKRDIVLIGAPVDDGAGQRGCGLAPDVLRLQGLAEALEGRGCAIRDLGNLLPEARRNGTPSRASFNKASSVVAWTAVLKQAAFKAMGQGIPIFLGGDHSLAAGTISGIAQYAEKVNRPLYVLWIDAHPDFHTPRTSASGNFHGMPLAYVTGQPGFERALPPPEVPLPPENLLMMAVRQIDPPEQEALEQNGICVQSMQSLKEDGFGNSLPGFLDRVRKSNGLLHVSLDVDALDPEIAPGTGMKEPQGLSAELAGSLLDRLRESGLVTSFEVAELNPALDQGGRTAQLIVALTARLFGAHPVEQDVRASETMKTEKNAVPFVSVDHIMNIINGIGADTVIADMKDYIEQDFRRWRDFEKVPRLASHSRLGVIELMPTTDRHLYGFKYVNGHPKNMKEGLQTVTAFGVLADVETGYPVLLSEMTFLTALRTAATSAMAAQYLAPPNAGCMAIIGNGAQCEFQAIAFRKLLGIRKMRLFDTDRAATEKAIRNLSALDMELVGCRTPQEAVEGAQIITTATADKQFATILTDNLVGSGVHINAVGGDCPGKTEIEKGVLLRSRVFVEYEPQTRIEGDIQQLPSDYPVTELWQVMTGAAPGRTHPDQITLFDSVGFAIEDFSALRYLRDQLARTGGFEKLDMIADPDDPRDLYGMLMRAASVKSAA